MKYNFVIIMCQVFHDMYIPYIIYGFVCVWGPCTQCYTIAISNVASCNTLAYNNVMKCNCVQMYMCLLRVEISTRRSAIAEPQHLCMMILLHYGHNV